MAKPWEHMTRGERKKKTENGKKRAKQKTWKAISRWYGGGRKHNAGNKKSLPRIRHPPLMSQVFLWMVFESNLWQNGAANENSASKKQTNGNGASQDAGQWERYQSRRAGQWEQRKSIKGPIGNADYQNTYNMYWRRLLLANTHTSGAWYDCRHMNIVQNICPAP